ncbi:hypothetical protein LguiA_015581 [Lonicera macranthoides]
MNQQRKQLLAKGTTEPVSDVSDAQPKRGRDPGGRICGFSQLANAIFQGSPYTY